MMKLAHRYARYLFIILTFSLFSSEVRRVISSLSIDLQCTDWLVQVVTYIVSYQPYTVKNKVSELPGTGKPLTFFRVYSVGRFNASKGAFNSPSLI
jgi:hypothetical protein